MPIFLVRHPEPATSGEGLCIGQTDVELSPRGAAAIRGLTRTLIQQCRPERILTSDLKRCSQLAEAIGAKAELPVETSRVWRELDFGDWEGRSWDEIHQEKSSEYEAWTADYVNVAPPGGESFRQLSRRVSNAIKDFVASEPERTTLIVTHAGVIRALCASSLATAFDYEVPFGSCHPLKLTFHDS